MSDKPIQTELYAMTFATLPMSPSGNVGGLYYLFYELNEISSLILNTANTYKDHIDSDETYFQIATHFKGVLSQPELAKKILSTELIKTMRNYIGRASELAAIKSKLQDRIMKYTTEYVKLHPDKKDQISSLSKLFEKTAINNSSGKSLENAMLFTQQPNVTRALQDGELIEKLRNMNAHSKKRRI
jgi:hypothetical protein